MTDDEIINEIKADIKRTHNIMPYKANVLIRIALTKLRASLKVAEMPTDLSEPIQDALYATGRFTTDECETLCEGILLYINEFRNRMKEPKSKAIEMPTEEDRQFCEEIKVIAISNYAADIPRLIIRLFRNRMSKPNNFTGMESLECDCPESDRMHMPDNEPDVCTKCGKKFN